MTKNSKVPNVGGLFQSAEEKGNISKKVVEVLTIVEDLGAKIQEGIGIDVDDVAASEVVLVTQLIDDSGSIRFRGNTQAVRDGHNLVIEEVLKETKGVEGVLAHTRYLNGYVAFDYRPLVQAILLDQNNYNPNGGTPLYDEAIVILGTVLAKAEEFDNNNVPVRTVTLIVTDGDDQGSRFDASDVAVVVKSMLQQETQNNIIAAMGIDDGTTDYRRVFSEMGILDEWIYTTEPESGETVEDHRRRIRRGFQMFSKTASQVTKGGEAASFSQTALGSIGND